MITTMNGSGQIRNILRDDARHPLRDLLHANRIFDGLALVRGILDLAVEAADVAHAQHRHELIAPLHLGDAPAQRVRRLFHVRHHRRERCGIPS
jgi:hypothetical protein